MILTEEGKNKLFALVLFLVSGFIGILGLQLPIDNTLLLFPIFCGFFGVSTLLLQLRNSVEMPKQHASETYVSKRLINTSVISGWLAGVFSGLLPGIGASEIASIVSSGKNEHSFLVRLGAITMANVILSILALWLIGKSRSGLSLVIEQLMQIGLNETLLVLATALIATGIASMVAIVIAQKSLSFLKDVGYNNLGTATVLFIIVLSAAFAGPYGLLLLATCTSIGLLTNIAKVKRGILMGVLILPTIVFYLP
jgi:putative membrane protein